MAKRQSRSSRAERRSSREERPSGERVIETAPPRLLREESDGRPADLVGEYHYVVRDLGQISLIAGGLIAALIALSFILPK